jgi:hypothetical protein
MRPVLGLVCLAFTLLPAQVDNPATPVLDCSGRSLRIMAPNMDGLGITCTVSGADGDDSFVVGVHEPDGVTFTELCQAPLTSGTGICSAPLIRPTEVWQAGVTVIAELPSSGTTIGPVLFGGVPVQTSINPLPPLPDWQP